MAEAHPAPSLRPDRIDPLTSAQEQVLERAVAKTVRLGEQVGVTTDQMILLLESGWTVAELLEYLITRNRESLQTGQNSILRLQQDLQK